MKKYFVTEGFMRNGPFDIEELRNLNIKKETIIWTFDFGEKPAGEIEELQVLFGGAAPAEKNKSDETPKTSNDEELLKKYEEIKKQQEIEQKKKLEEQKIEEQKIKKEPEFKDNPPVITPLIIEQQEVEITEIEINQLFEEKNEQYINQDQVKDDIYENELNYESDQKEYNEQQLNYETKTDIEYNSFVKKQSEFQGQKKPPINQTAVKTNLIFSIITTLLCCLPFGIVGIVYSTQADRKAKEGDIAGAQKAARTAMAFNIFGIVSGIIGWIIVMANAG